MALEKLLATIPYVVWHDVQVVEETRHRVCLSLQARPEIANYVGIMHAGAIYTLAETAAGCVANSVIDANAAFVLLRDANVCYTRKADGEITATGTVAEAEASAARAAFAESARADIAVEVDITDGGDETVFAGTFNYALRPRKS